MSDERQLAPKAVGLDELGEASAKMSKVFGSGILPVFIATCAAEAAFLLVLPGSVAEVAGPMMRDPAWGLLDVPLNAAFLGLAVLLMTAVGLLRVGLYSPLRKVVLDDVALTPREVLSDASRRILPVFLVQQLVGLFIVGATLVCLLLGLQITIIPFALVSFVLAPAIYLVAAHDRGVVRAVVDSVTITRNNLFATFAVQGLLLVFATWLGEFIRATGDLAGLAAAASTLAVVAVVLTYRFAHFWAMSSLYLALDANGHC